NEKSASVSSAAVTGSAVTVDKLKLNQTLQDAKAKQKVLTGKIADEKAQGGEVGGLTAQLADVSKTVSKTQLQVNQ
ncbi:MAG: hypothetical protein PHH28_16980, partial [Desulfuromonadaceae bacterium]|nr:hypothetical protein [Desulfuromonadaceae bacterium]